MARKLRLQYAGAVYHLTVRGNGRRRIFFDDPDRERFLWRLSESQDLYKVRIHLFALMANHAHILAETPRANIARFMRSLLTGYTVYFNLRHNTCGHLLQERYGAQRVQGAMYLLRSWVDRQYRRLGEFAASDEDVSLRREARVSDPQRIVTWVANSFGLSTSDMQRTLPQSTARPMAAYLLCKFAGLSQREAARHLGYGTGAAVSIQIKHLRNRIQHDPETEKYLKHLEKQIADDKGSVQG